MGTFQATATISRPHDEVWAYAADIRRHDEWMAITDLRLVRGVGTVAGDRGRERLRLGPLSWDVEFEVAEAVPGRTLRWHSVDDPRLDLEVALDLEPDGAEATLATYRATIALHGRWRLVAPLGELEGASGVRRELERLRANVEAVPSLARG